MIRFILFVILLLFPIEVGAGPCFPSSKPVENLLKNHKEELAGIGLQGNGWIIELYKSDSGSTWSLIARSPTGPVCIISVGEHWEMATTVKKGGSTWNR